MKLNRGTALVPAAARAAARKPEPVAQAIQETINQLEITLGGRDQLISVLAHNPSTTALVSFLGDLAKPEHRRLNLATLCLKNGLTIGDLLKAYQAGMRLYAETLAVREIAEKEVAVTRDVMTRALPEQVACGVCEGTGRLAVFDKGMKTWITDPCKACDGTGKVLSVPPVERQKLALDLADLLPKKNGMMIGINNSTTVNPVAGGFGGTLERFQQSISEILYGEPTIEAELVEPSSSEEV